MKKKNFTLVELLCAAGLVVILAGIGFSAYSYASHRGKEAATKSLIARIEAGLETLKNKHGFYPSSNGAYQTVYFTINSSTGIVTHAFFNGSSSGTSQLTEAQLKDFLAVVDAESLRQHLVLDSGTAYKLTDAWGGEIKYKYPGTINTIKFDIVAPGADERFGISSSSNPPTVISGYKNGDEWACDDIANFK